LKNELETTLMRTVVPLWRYLSSSDVQTGGKKKGNSSKQAVLKFGAILHT